MNSSQNISDAGLYTDFNGLQKLRSKVTGPEKTAESQQATKEVAKQFESLFLQMMLKEMREASTIDGSTESDETRFYQEMFDKQVALNLANSGNGGLGIADFLERDLGGNQLKKSEQAPIVDNIELVRNQINRLAAQMQLKDNSGQE